MDIDIEKKTQSRYQTSFLELSEVVWSDPGFLDSTGQPLGSSTSNREVLNFAGLELKDNTHLLGEEIDEGGSQTPWV